MWNSPNCLSWLCLASGQFYIRVQQLWLELLCMRGLIWGHVWPHHWFPDLAEATESCGTPPCACPISYFYPEARGPGHVHETRDTVVTPQIWQKMTLWGVSWDPLLSRVFVAGSYTSQKQGTITWCKWEWGGMKGWSSNKTAFLAQIPGKRQITTPRLWSTVPLVWFHLTCKGTTE